MAALRLFTASRLPLMVARADRMSACGTTRTSWDVRHSVAIRGKADIKVPVASFATAIGTKASGWGLGERSSWFYCRALIWLNSKSARSNLRLKSHIATRISPKVADFLVLSARPNAKMLLFRRYPMILGSEIL